MRGYILRLSVIAGFLVVAAGAAHADVCVTIDYAHDTLQPEDQAAALLLVARQFELADERVVPAGCTTPYSVSHIRLGNVIVVNLSGPNDQREATALGMDDLAALYNQMVQSIVTGRPMTGFNVVNRTNVTASQASERRVHSDSLWYARLGYGGVFGDRAYGTPALGFGYRAELDSFAIDVSFLNVQLGTSDGNYASSGGSARSLLKLSGLYFLNPQANRTGYLGGGLSYGTRSFGGGWSPSTTLPYTHWEGSGLQGELTIGYELARATTLRLFLQADAVFPFYQVTSQLFRGSDWSPRSIGATHLRLLSRSALAVKQQLWPYC
jgi:hypothetical protein